MKRQNLIATSIVAAALFAIAGCASSRARGTDSQRVNPNISSPDTSYGGTQSERERQTGVPLPEGSSQTGTVAPRGSNSR